MEVYVGTSGWSYDWNNGGNFEWFVNNAGLNAVELNASFYRFPFKNQIEGWRRRSTGIHWCVKVHRLITHTHKFNDAALEIWKRFKDLFQPLSKSIDFYLFQAPPRFTDVERILSFIGRIDEREKVAIELRNETLLENDEVCKRIQKYSVLVSVDSPTTQCKIYSSDIVYLRMHGRGEWYQYKYSKKELQQIAKNIIELNPKKAFIFFNNNHNMLKNAQTMFNLLLPQMSVIEKM